MHEPSKDGVVLATSAKSALSFRSSSSRVRARVAGIAAFAALAIGATEARANPITEIVINNNSEGSLVLTSIVNWTSQEFISTAPSPGGSGTMPICLDHIPNPIPAHTSLTNTRIAFGGKVANNVSCTTTLCTAPAPVSGSVASGPVPVTVSVAGGAWYGVGTFTYTPEGPNCKYTYSGAAPSVAGSAASFDAQCTADTAGDPIWIYELLNGEWQLVKPLIAELRPNAHDTRNADLASSTRAHSRLVGHLGAGEEAGARAVDDGEVVEGAFGQTEGGPSS